MEEKKKILIVEDEASMAELEQDYLELSGLSGGDRRRWRKGLEESFGREL